MFFCVRLPLPPLITPKPNTPSLHKPLPPLTNINLGSPLRLPLRRPRPALPHPPRFLPPYLRTHDDIPFVSILPIFPRTERRECDWMQFLIFPEYVYCLLSHFLRRF
jgi:hypothetical protein